MEPRKDSASRRTAPSRSPIPAFLAATIVLFFSGLSVTDSFGFVPYYIDGSTPAHQTLALADLPMLGEADVSGPTTLPARIKSDTIGLDLPVQNPATRDIAALDALLTNGPARYVDSAKLGEKGNVIIFAHSSHLPIVHNKMYQAFNNIPELAAGDSITLLGDNGTSYLYRVESVRKADVESGVSIDLSPSEGHKLTLVTCDTLTGKSARYILTAELVGTI